MKTSNPKEQPNSEEQRIDWPVITELDPSKKLQKTYHSGVFLM